MHIPVAEAEAQLADLVRRAEAGDDIVLTRQGQPAVRLVPIMAVPDVQKRQALLEALYNAQPTEGPCAARSQDFLFDDCSV